MSKLSHSNPNLDDVLHDGNKHILLGQLLFPNDNVIEIMQNFYEHYRGQNGLNSAMAMKAALSHPAFQTWIKSIPPRSVKDE